MVFCGAQFFLFLYSVTSNHALSALQLLKHKLIYSLFFIYPNIHMATIVGAVVQVHFHSRLTFMHSEELENAILNLLSTVGGL